MSRVKIFLLWLCMLAVPVQGMAAALMLACGPDPQTRAAAVSMAAAAHAGEHAAHPHSGMHDRHGAHAHDGHAVLGHHDDGSHHHKVDNQAHKCSACASCCVGAAMLMPPLQWHGVVDAGSSPIAWAQARPAAVFPGGLERPPRSLSA